MERTILPQTQNQPLYKKWWLWMIIIGIVVIVIIIIVVAVVLTRKKSDDEVEGKGIDIPTKEDFSLTCPTYINGFQFYVDYDGSETSSSNERVNGVSVLCQGESTYSETYGSTDGRMIEILDPNGFKSISFAKSSEIINENGEKVSGINGFKLVGATGESYLFGKQRNLTSLSCSSDLLLKTLDGMTVGNRITEFNDKSCFAKGTTPTPSPTPPTPTPPTPTPTPSPLNPPPPPGAQNFNLSCPSSYISGARVFYSFSGTEEAKTNQSINGISVLCQGSTNFSPPYGSTFGNPINISDENGFVSIGISKSNNIIDESGNTISGVSGISFLSPTGANYPVGVQTNPTIYNCNQTQVADGLLKTLIVSVKNRLFNVESFTCDISPAERQKRQADQAKADADKAAAEAAAEENRRAQEAANQEAINRILGNFKLNDNRNFNRTQNSVKITDNFNINYLITPFETTNGLSLSGCAQSCLDKKTNTNPLSICKAFVYSGSGNSSVCELFRDNEYSLAGSKSFVSETGKQFYSFSGTQLSGPDNFTKVNNASLTDLRTLSSSTANLEECARLCLVNFKDSCLSFNHKSSDGRCVINSSRARDLQIATTSSDIIGSITSRTLIPADGISYYERKVTNNVGEIKSTKTNDWGNGDPIYLDRHTVDCKNKPIIGFQLDTFSASNSDSKFINYDYVCSSMGDLGTSFERSTASSSRGKKGEDDNGDTNYLDRHNLDCGPAAYISKFKLDHNSSRKEIKYDYTCISSTKPLTQRKVQTPVNDLINDESIYLDRHNVQCKNDEGLSQFRLRSTSDGNKIYYEYTCSKPS